MHLSRIASACRNQNSHREATVETRRLQLVSFCWLARYVREHRKVPPDEYERSVRSRAGCRKANAARDDELGALANVREQLVKAGIDVSSSVTDGQGAFGYSLNVSST